VSKTIATLTAVVALTLAACATTTASTTTTEDTRGWSDEAFRDVMAYCQAAERVTCAALVLELRDTVECSVEATYRIIDVAGDGLEVVNDLMRDVLHPAGDCLVYTIPDE